MCVTDDLACTTSHYGTINAQCVDNDCSDPYVSKTFPDGGKLCQGPDCKCCVHKDEGKSFADI